MPSLGMRVVKDTEIAVLPYIVLSKYGNPIARFLEEKDAINFKFLKEGK